MSKPYKGEITILAKRELPDELRTQFPGTLGYFYKVDFHNHPRFRGREAFGGYTSVVVAEHDLGNGLIEIETLNSVYHMRE